MKFCIFVLLVFSTLFFLQSCESRSVSSTVAGGIVTQSVIFVGDNGSGLRRPQIAGLDGPLHRDLFAFLPGESLNSSGVSLSPDGDWLGTTTQDGRHRIIDVETGDFTEIIVDNPGLNSIFRFGPQGILLLRNELAGAGPGEVPSELYIANADGSGVRRLGWSARQYEFLGWSQSDGQLLTYIRDFPSLDEQWRILDAAGYLVADPLAGLNGPLVSSAWSDTHLAFTTPREVFGATHHALHQYRKFNGQVSTLLPSSMSILELQYSPDSQFLTALVRTSSLAETVLSLHMSATHTFADLLLEVSEARDVRLRDWAPDSSAVAFTYRRASGAPDLLNISDGLGVGFPIIEVGPNGSTVGEVVWSPDSRYLAFVRDSNVAGVNELLVHDIHSGSAYEQALLPGQLGLHSQLAWAPDSSTLFAFFDPENGGDHAVVAFQASAWDQGLTIGSLPLVFPPAVRHGDQERSLIPSRDSSGAVWVQLDPITNRRGVVFSDLDPSTPPRVLSSPGGVLDQVGIHRFFVR